MLERYCRASRLTAPRVAAATAGMWVEGYWIDESRYFFLDEKFEPSLKRIVGVPSIANAVTGGVEVLARLDDLARVLSGHAGRSIGMPELSAARFDLPDQHTLAVAMSDQCYLVSLPDMRVRETIEVLAAPGLYSPNGQLACFLKDFNLWIRDLETGTEHPLTRDGQLHHAYGYRSEAGLGAVSYRNYPLPMGLWSADSKWLLTCRIDERSAPDIGLLQHAPPGGARPILHRYKYPMPGDPIPIATYVAIHVPSRRVVSFQDFPVPVVLPFGRFERTACFGQADQVWLLRFDRYFKQVDLINLDLVSATGRVVISEKADTGYLDVHPVMSMTPNVQPLTSGEIVWFSERSGWGHLYLYDAGTGSIKNAITEGTWLVRDLVHVDEPRRRAYFLASGLDRDADPARRSLCSARLDGGDLQVHLTHDGDVFVPPTGWAGAEQVRRFRPANSREGVAPGSHFAIARRVNVERGNVTEILELRSERSREIAAARPAEHEVRARTFSALAADGVTRLHGVMFLPSDFDESARYPLVDSCYPGPHVTWQPQSFASMRSAQARSLAELGFVTFMLDTRAMPIGSRARQQCGYGQLLEPQLADHAAVVRQLCARLQFIDPDRVGMIGQSGGGAATVRALCDYGDVFKVGVAAYGNHDSSLYTALWSDRYRGPGPGIGWPEQANDSVASKLQGKLFLISGDMDENVHVSQTVKLADALVRANKDFDLLIVPNAGHGVLVTNGYAQRRAWDFLVRHLLATEPPHEFQMVFESHELAQFGRNVGEEMR